MKEVGKDELLQTLHSFQNDKIPRPNDLPMELFLGCYEFIEDLRMVVETTRDIRKMLVAYNTTFIALIPKEDNLLLKSFDQYSYAIVSTKLF